MLGAMIAAGGGATSGAVFGVGGPSSEKISEPMFEGNSAVSVKVADQSSDKSPDNNKNSITSITGKDPQSKDNKIQAGEKSNNFGNGSPMGSNGGIKNNGDNNGKGDAAGVQGNINKVSEKNGNNQGKANGGNENGGSLNSSGSNGNSNSGFDIKNEKSSNERETFKENQGGVSGVNNGNINNVGANKPNSNSGSSGSGVKDGGNGSNGSGNKSGGNVSNGEGNGSSNGGGINEKNSNGPNESGREPNSQEKSQANGGGGNLGNNGANNMGASGNGKNGNTNGSGDKNGGNISNGAINGNSNNAGGINDKSNSVSNGGGETNNQDNSRAGGGSGNSGKFGANSMSAGGNGKDGNTNSSGNKNGGNVNNEGGNGNSNSGGGFNEKSASGPDGKGREANNQENSRTDGGGGNFGNVGSNNMGAGGNGKNGNTIGSGDKSGGNISNGGGSGNENSNNGGGFNEKDGNGRNGKENEVNNQENLRASGGSGNLGNGGANNMGAGGNGKDRNTNSFGDKNVGNAYNERVNGNSNNGGGFNEKSISGSDERGRETLSQENSRMGGGGGNVGNIGANNNGAGENGKDGSYDDKSGGNVSNGAKSNSNNANGLYGKNCNGPNGREKEANTQENSKTGCVDGNSGNAGTNNMGVVGTGNNGNTDSFRDQSKGNGIHNGGNGLTNNAGRINEQDNYPEGRGSEANDQKNLRTSGNSGKIGANNMGASVNENDRNTNDNSNKYATSLLNGSGSGNGINGGETNGRNGNCPDGSVSGANSQKNLKLGGDSGSSGNTANNMGAGGNGNNGNANGFINKSGGTTLDGGPNDNGNNGFTNCLNGRVTRPNSQEGLKTGEGGRSSVNVGNYMVASRETGMNGKDSGNNGGGINGKNENGSDKRESAEESQTIMRGAGSYNEIKNMEKNNMDESKFYGNRGGSESNSGKDTGGCTLECNNKFNTGVNGKSSLTSGSGDMRDGNIFINNRGSGFFGESAGNAGSNGILPDERRRNENGQEKIINAISFKDNYEARDIGTESSNINVDNNKSGDRDRVDNNIGTNIGTKSLFNRFGFSLDNRMKSKFFNEVGADKNAFITNGETIFKGKIVGNDHTSNEYGLTNARVSVGVNGVGGADKSRLFELKNFNQNTNSNQNQNIKNNENILCDTHSSVIRDNTINKGCGTPNGNINFDLTENFVNRAFEDGRRATGSKNDLASVLGVNFHNNNQDINADHENNKDFTKLNANSFDALKGNTIVAEPTHRGNNILFTEHNSEIFSDTINGRSHESSSREGVSCVKGCNIVSGVNELGLINPKHVNNNIQSSDNQMESILVQSSSSVVPSKVNGFKIGSRANGDYRDHSDGDVDRSNKVEIDKIENYEEIKNGPNFRVQTGSNENVNMGFVNDRCSCNKDTSLVSMDRYCSCNKVPTDSQNPGGNLTHQFVKFFENIAGKLHVNELVAVEEIVENIKNSHKSQTKTNLHEAKTRVSNTRVSSPVVKDKLPIPQEKLNNYFSPAIKTIVET